MSNHDADIAVGDVCLAFGLRPHVIASLVDDVNYLVAVKKCLGTHRPRYLAHPPVCLCQFTYLPPEAYLDHAIYGIYADETCPHRGKDLPCFRFGRCAWFCQFRQAQLGPKGVSGTVALALRLFPVVPVRPAPAGPGPQGGAGQGPGPRACASHSRPHEVFLSCGLKPHGG